MAAAAMLNSGYRAFFVIIYVLLLGVATFLPNLVKIGLEMSEQHQFHEIQDGGNRFDSGYRAIIYVIDVLKCDKR